jgi:hypothetical protein
MALAVREPASDHDFVAVDGEHFAGVEPFENEQLENE